MTPILPLPCGCVADSDGLVTRHIVVCPWCGASVTLPEFKAWLFSGGHVLWATRPPRDLIRRGEAMLEVIGHCNGCQVPVVRQLGHVTEEHLRERVSPVRN